MIFWLVVFWVLGLFYGFDFVVGLVGRFGIFKCDFFGLRGI